MAAIATESGYNKCCQEIVCNTLIVIEELYLTVSVCRLPDVSCALPEPKALCGRLKVTAKLKC